MPANDEQVGGRHYKTSYEHWDLIIETKAGYLEGCATKYVSRWRKKAGILDLQKALHYCNKLLEVAVARVLPERAKYFALVGVFATENELSPLEREAVAALICWQTTDNIRVAISAINQLIAIAEMPSDARPVPLTEENHHAERHRPQDEGRGADETSEAPYRGLSSIR